MPARRTALLALSAAGLLALPACLMPTVHVSDPSPPGPRTPKPAGDRFAESITAPGQRVALNDAPPAAPAPVVTAARGGPVEPPGAVPAPPPPPAGDGAQHAGAVNVLSPEPSAFRPPAADPPVLDALRRHLENRADADDPLRGLPRPNQELLGCLLPLVSAATSADLSGRNPAQAAVVAKQLTAVAEVAADAAPLVVRKAVFVERVRQYGDYDPVPPEHRFLPGGGLAMLYVEIDNVPSVPTPRPTGGPGYLTLLSASLQVRDAAGAAVEQLAPQQHKPVSALRYELKDHPRSPIRDFYVPFQFGLPPKPGRYTVTIEVRDPATGRTVRHEVPFRVDGN